jgi:hypothetical protein
MITPEFRTAVYTAIPAIAAVLIVFGLITEEEAAVLVAAILAVAGVVLAWFNRPTKGA